MTDPTRRESAPGHPGVVTPPIQVDDVPGRGGARGGGGAPMPPAPPVHTERRRRAVGWRSTDVLRTAALVIAMYVALRLLWFANALLLTTFLGILFGLAVAAGVDRLERLRIPRGVGAATIVLSFFGLLTLLGIWMAPTLREQGAELRQRLPEAVDRVQDWINRRQGFMSLLLRPPGSRPAGAGAAGGAAAPGARGPQTAPGPTAGTPAPTEPARPGAQGAEQTTPGGTPATARGELGGAQREPGPPSATETLSSRLGGQMGSVVRYLFPFLQSTIAAVAGVLLIIFLAIYIAADPNTYHAGLMHLFPKPARARAGEILSAMATVLRKWLVTQLIAMATIGAVSTAVLLALDVKAALALGVLAGLLEFIPTIGPILSGIPAVAMGFIDSPQKALYIALAYMGIQFLENHILIPILMKGGIDIPPALTILAQALATLLFGFLGLMVAVPLMAASMVAVKMLYVEGVVGDDLEVFDHSARDDGADDG